jgi:hypothetical protein
MNRLPSLVAIGIVLSAVCYAQHCPDPRLQQAVIGGDTIDGFVFPHHKPLKFAEVRLLFPNGKTAWTGTTDSEGGFHIRHLRPDAYRLVVQGWGSTMIRISADLTKLPNGQTVRYSVQLMDDECIGWNANTN